MKVDSTNWYNPDWFNTKAVDLPDGSKGTLAVPKSECWKDIRAAIAEFNAEKASQSSRNAKAVELTDAQISHLSAKYDPSNMSRSEYEDFIAELCDYGILEAEDRKWVQADGVEHIYIDMGAPAHRQVDMNGPESAYAGFTEAFSSNDGNVRDWVKYMSGFLFYNQYTMDFEPTKSAVLFGKIDDVLSRI